MKYLFPTTFLAALSSLGVTHGEPVKITSQPLGYTTAALNGSPSTGSRQTNIVAPNLVNAASWQGAVISISGNQVTLGENALPAGTFNKSSRVQQAYTYYLITEDGYWSHIVSNDGSSITLPAGYAGSLAVGEKIAIRRHITIQDYLGNNEVGLKGSAAGKVSEADYITLQDDATASSMIIFPSESFGGHWVNSSLENAGAVPIYPHQALQISRISTGPLTLETTGEVETRPLQIPVSAGTNIRTIASAVPTRLGDLTLYTGDSTTGVVGSPTGNVSKADTLRVLINGQNQTYFYWSAASGAGWYDSSLQPVNDVVLPSGAGFIIRRTNPTNSSPFVWKTATPDIQ